VSGSSSTKAKDLIYTTNFVEGTMSVGDLKSWFQTQLSAVSIGVVNGKEYGLITRRHLNQHLVSTSYNKSKKDYPITDIMVQEPLVVDADDTLDTVVNRLCREKQEDEEFFNDIVVLEDGRFMGLLSVREALTNHVENISHMLTATSAQKQALSNKNKQLFDNNFKSGFMGSQFRMLFDEAYLPMLYFTEEGKLDAFNRRFLELSGLPRHQMENNAMFGQLFELNFSKVLDAACQHRDLMDSEQGFMREVTMKVTAGSTLLVNAYFEATADKRRLMVNILSAGEPEDDSQNALENIYDVAPQTGNAPGKITQAINTKLVNEHAMGLARSVATNLIDREQSIDRLMSKLEHVIHVAEEIETLGASDASAGEAKHHLNGNLSDFSMIDLCQILSQGHKTGCLNVENGETGSIGKLFFYNGQIIHGFTNEGYQGVESLPALLGMRAGDFVFQLDEQPESVTIEGDTMGLLMEACQNLDEKD
jgi:PAS domain-containing protein